jgi:hypothetical protein
VKKVGVVLLMGAALGLASPAMADQIQVGFSGSSYGPFQTGLGGEFTVNDINGTPANSWLNLSGYVAGTTSNFGPSGGPSITSFQTFCIEENEYLYPYGAIYDVAISGQAVNGGVGGPHPDPLSQGTAYLYSQFAQGALDGYNYGTGRSATAAALQEAIWWLEQEIISYTAGNHFIDLVAAQFTTLANARGDATAGQYGVYVLNLTGAGGGAPSGQAQDQLYYNPSVTNTAVPDSGTTLALQLMALCALAIVSHRFRRA